MSYDSVERLDSWGFCAVFKLCRWNRCVLGFLLVTVLFASIFLFLSFFLFFCLFYFFSLTLWLFSFAFFLLYLRGPMYLPVFFSCFNYISFTLSISTIHFFLILFFFPSNFSVLHFFSFVTSCFCFCSFYPFIYSCLSYFPLFAFWFISAFLLLFFILSVCFQFHFSYSSIQ